MKHKEKLIRELLKNFNGPKEDYDVLYNKFQNTSIKILEFLEPEKYEIFVFESAVKPIKTTVS